VRELSEYGVLLEFTRVGNAIKVCAIDQKSGTEVSIMGPSSASEADLREVVIRKLKYVMAKES
jgi:hypothetical protein